MKRKQRFSIRKSTLGVASVLLGIFAVGATTVMAGTIIPMINGVEQAADKVENVADDEAAIEQATKEVVAKYRQKNYKLQQAGTRVEGDTLYLNFTELAADDANYRIVVKIDGNVVSDITHVVNATRAQELAVEALELFSEDNKYSLVSQNVTDVTSEGATLTLELKSTKRAYKIIDKDGAVQEAEFPAMTETAWLEILNDVIAANTTDTQVLDEAASRFDDANQVDVLVFKEKTENFVVKVVIDGNEQVSNYDGITYSQLLDIIASINETNKELVAGEVKYEGNTVTLNFTTPVAPKSDYTIVVAIDGVATTSEYKDITHAQFLEALSAVMEANKELVAGEVSYEGNKVTLNFTTPAAPKGDYTIVVVVDGVASTSEYKDITHAQFLEALSAVAEANKELVAGEVSYEGNKVTLNFSTKAVEETKSDYTIVVVVDGVASTNEYKGITHTQFLEALAAITEANNKLQAGAVNFEGNKVTLNFTTPAAPKGDYTIVVVVDGVASTHEYKGITHAQFLEALAALTEANNKLQAGAVNFEGNKVTLNFTTPAAPKGDYTIVVVVDGVASTHEYKGITHAQFLEALAALTEANNKLEAGAVHFEGNKVTLNFKTPAERKDEWVGDDFVGSKDTDAKTIVSVDKVVDDKGQKLPETGTEGFVAQMVLGASALLGSLGLALKKKKR